MTIVAYRIDYIDTPNAGPEWYCPTCYGELEPPGSGTDHLRETAIADVCELPAASMDVLGMRYCDADCGRFLATGKTLFEMAAS